MEGPVNCKIGDLFAFEYGKSLTKKERKETGSYPVYGSNGIVGFHDEYLVEGPAIIIGRKGAVGEVELEINNLWPIDTTYYVKVPESLDFKYSYFLLKSLVLSRLDKSTAIPGLNRNDAYDLNINLPSLPEQRAIVSKIEQLFSDLDNGIANLKLAQEQLKVYRRAVLDQTTKTEKFVPIANVIEELGQGWSPKCHNEPSTNDEEWGVIKTTAIQAGYFNEKENKKLPASLEPKLKHELKAGDILITRAGPRVRVGICCLVKKVIVN